MDFSNIDEGHAEGEENFHYYFNHEERIKRAPKIVQDFYDGKNQMPRGFFRILVASPVNRVGLFSIFALAAFIAIYSLAFSKPFRKTIAGVQLTLSSFSFSDEVFVSLSAKPARAKSQREKSSKEDKEQGDVPNSKLFEVSLHAIDNQNAVVHDVQESVLYSEDKESVIFRAKFTDYDIVEIRAEIICDDEQTMLVSSIIKQ